MKARVRALAIGAALLAAGATASTAQPKINDAQIAAIAVAANQVDVDAGKLALSKGKSGDVKQFAQTMVTDHGGAIKAATDLVTRLKVTPQDVAEMHAAIRAELRQLLGDRGSHVRILYGGSVKPDNAASLFAVPDVDGALVGGASLTAAKFVPIVAAAAAL